MATATKVSGVVTYYEGLPPIKAHGPLITWSCEITWQTKNIMIPLPEWPWTPNFAGW